MNVSTSANARVETDTVIEKSNKVTSNWLTLHSYDLVGSRKNQELFLSMTNQLHQTAN